MTLTFLNASFVCKTMPSRHILRFLSITAGLATVCSTGFAQNTVTQMTPNGTVNAAVAALPTSLSASFGSADWNSLTPAQRTALKPLAASWANLSDIQKRKWISLSVNYQHMSVPEQTKLHGRMAQWAALTPRQREQARLNFAETKQITPQQKNEHWQTYQALSPEEKQKLAKSAQPKPPSTALAAQPVTSDKINRMPMTTGVKGAALPASAPALSKNTLLTKPTLPVPPKPPKAPTPAVLHDANSQ